MAHPLTKLSTLAQQLDQKGHFAFADQIDSVIERIAGAPQTPEQKAKMDALKAKYNQHLAEAEAIRSQLQELEMGQSHLDMPRTQVQLAPLQVKQPLPSKLDSK